MALTHSRVMESVWLEIPEDFTQCRQPKAAGRRARSAIPGDTPEKLLSLPLPFQTGTPDPPPEDVPELPPCRTVSLDLGLALGCELMPWWQEKLATPPWEPSFQRTEDYGSHSGG